MKSFFAAAAIPDDLVSCLYHEPSVQLLFSQFYTNINLLNSKYLTPEMKSGFESQVNKAIEDLKSISSVWLAEEREKTGIT
jgi:hypothetical protein